MSRPTISEIPPPPARGTQKSPTSRTLELLKSRGYTCGIAERRAPWRSNLTIDLFHIVDIIAIRPGEIVGVQSTGSDFAGHRKKLTVTRADNSARWIASGAGLLLIGWRKLKGKWTPRELWIGPEDLQPRLKELGRLDLLDCRPWQEEQES